MHFTRFDGAGTSAVAADDGRRFQLAFGNDLTHLAADAAGLDANDLALLDVLGNRVMRFAQRGRGDGEILQAQLFDGGFHDHIHHIVAVAQVMMEGEGHAVLRAALTQRIGDGRHDLALLRLFIAAGAGGSLLHVFAVHVVFALINFLAVYKQLVRDIASYCIFHTKSPSYMPHAFASFNVRSAPGMNATSTIFPLTVNTPIPAAAASRNALTIASACMTSFSVGAKIW